MPNVIVITSCVRRNATSTYWIYSSYLHCSQCIARLYSAYWVVYCMFVRFNVLVNMTLCKQLDGRPICCCSRYIASHTCGTSAGSCDVTYPSVRRGCNLSRGLWCDAAQPRHEMEMLMMSHAHVMLLSSVTASAAHSRQHSHKPRRQHALLAMNCIERGY